MRATVATLPVALFVVALALVGCSKSSGGDLAEGQATVIANAEYDSPEGSSCETLAQEFGDKLDTAVQRAKTTGEVDGEYKGDFERPPEVQRLYAVGDAVMAHVNRFQFELAHRKLRCDPEVLLAAAETRLSGSSQEFVLEGTTMDIATWRQSMLVMLRPLPPK